MAIIDTAEESERQNDLILVLNSGSSSLKFGLFYHSGHDEEPLLTGSADGIGRSNGVLRILSATGKLLFHRENVLDSQSTALAIIAKEIREQVPLSPVAVGHRVVHGGPNLLTHQLITAKVLDDLRSAVHFAPLHIPQALSIISASQSLFSSAAHFACFDDAFHRTMPEVASHLPIPRRFFDAGIRRYGFHGLSYESIARRLGSRLPARAIFAHLGNGASLCALRDGASIDTTMGLTPTGGIPMGTRCGDLDPGVLIYLLRTEKLGADALEDLLNHQSGLFALSSGESDVRALEERARSGDPNAILALTVFGIAVRKAVGAYIALLGEIDLLVFTGGIGEHSEWVRREATRGLEALSVTQDKVQVVPTEEDRQIARHCRSLIKQK